MTGQLKTVVFVGVVASRSEVTLVSKRIGTPYRVRWIRATFPLGCNDLVKVRLFMSPDATAPTSGEPTGVSVLRDYGQVDYLIGDGEQKWIDHDVEMEESGSWLKVHAENGDWAQHIIDVQVGIEIGERA